MIDAGGRWWFVGDQRYEGDYIMNEPSEGQRTAAREAAGSGTDSLQDARTSVSVKTFDASGPSSTGQSTTGGPVGPSEAFLGPFTLREVVFGGGVALAFIGTLLPFINGLVRYANFWNSMPLFFIGIGILLPVIALALLAGRRLGSPGLRVGSLSVDQFASVTAVLAATYFFLQTVTIFQIGPLLALIGSLAMLAATVAGPFLPVIKNDFVDRPEVAAHTAARPITAARPRPPKPAKPAPAATSGTASADSRPGQGRGHHDVPSGQAGVNPAAAILLQNGAGLYGAGGAGAVGAGAAASGQSGLEREASNGTPARGTADAPATSRDSADSADDEGGAHAVGSARESGSSGGGSADTARSQAPTESSDETRVHEVVRDDATRAYTANPSAEERNRQEPITATRSADEEPVVEAFWFAVGSPRPVFDEQTGREVFTLEPGDWEVGIEDRGDDFLVQDKRTGAIGILRDLRNIERAPRD